MKILITGGFGLLGSQFANFLINNFETLNIFVFTIDDGLYGHRKNLKAVARICNHSIDHFYLFKLFEQHKFDAVYHFASCIGPNDGLKSIDIHNFIYENNVVKTAKLISLCEKYNTKFIFASSLDQSGDPFVVSKKMAELDIKSRKNLKYSIVRFGQLFGEHQSVRLNNYNVFSTWIAEYLQNLPLSIPGPGNQKIVISYVQDLLKPLLNILKDKTHKLEVDFGMHEVTLNRLCRNFIGVFKFCENLELDTPITESPVNYLNTTIGPFSTSCKNAKKLGYIDNFNLFNNLYNFVGGIKYRKQKNRL